MNSDGALSLPTSKESILQDTTPISLPRTCISPKIVFSVGSSLRNEEMLGSSSMSNQQLEKPCVLDLVTSSLKLKELMYSSSSSSTGCSGYGSRIHQPTTKVVERIILRFDLRTHSYDATVRNSTFEETSFLLAHSSDLQFVSSRFRLVWPRQLRNFFLFELTVPCIS